MGTVITTGIKEIDRRLDLLAKREASKVARSAINAGLTVLAKAERSAIDSTSASPELKKALKKTIGKRLTTKLGPNPDVQAKAGLGVGRRPRGQKGKAKAAAKLADKKQKRLERGAKGVGVGPQDVHWFALGTRRRYQNQRGGGRKYVGMIKPSGIRSAKSAGSAVKAAIESKAKEKMDQSVNQLRRQ